MPRAGAGELRSREVSWLGRALCSILADAKQVRGMPGVGSGKVVKTDKKKDIVASRQTQGGGW